MIINEEGKEEIEARVDRVFDESVQLKDNAMLKHRKELFYEWDFEENEKLGLDIYKVTFGSGKIAWWNCPDCKESYDMPINLRAGRGANCPYCSGHRLLIGFNDMWTTNIELAKLLANPEDGYKHMQSSHTKVDWKCLDCGGILKNKKIYNINIRGFSCLRCSDGIKFPEKFMYNLLKEANIKFEFDSPQEWSDRKRYDFLFKSKEKAYIIETHGGQHYKESFSFNHDRKKTLEMEQDNDKLKEQLARENGIDSYIVIDARESTVEWIKNSILNSELMSIINKDDIDFENIGRMASKNLVKEVCNLWKSKTLTMAQLAEKVNLSHATVIAYLKRGAEIGWCDYVTGNRKPVAQLSKELDLIQMWNSSKEAGESLGFDGKCISSVCVGERKTTNGYRWMFKDDYESYLAGNLKPVSLVDKNSISIVQLDLDSNLIKVFDSLSEAGRSLGVDGSGNISAVCKNRSKTAYGFRWMYKEDYHKMIASNM